VKLGQAEVKAEIKEEPLKVEAASPVSEIAKEDSDHEKMELAEESPEVRVANNGLINWYELLTESDLV